MQDALFFFAACGFLCISSPQSVPLNKTVTSPLIIHLKDRVCAAGDKTLQKGHRQRHVDRNHKKQTSSQGIRGPLETRCGEEMSRILMFKTSRRQTLLQTSGIQQKQSCDIKTMWETWKGFTIRQHHCLIHNSL